MNGKKKYALILAGGSGTRMQSEIPKQFLKLNGKPILMHTLLKFKFCDETILVLPQAEVKYWKKLCTDYQFDLPHTIVHGGMNRFESVKNGLKSVSSGSLVAIHDGVRPCIDKVIIQHTFDEADKNGSSIAVVKLKDSLRKLDAEKGSVALDRSEYFLVQTPQTFQSDLILKAYQQMYKPFFTDDASVFEEDNGKIFITEGSYSNIKITTPEDLLIAEVLLKS